jgi:hypothetical protein
MNLGYPSDEESTDLKHLLVEKCGLQGCLKTGERLLGIRFTGKGGSAQPLEGSNFLSTLLAPLRIDHALGLGLAMFRVEEDPALRYPAITRGHHRTYTAVVRNGGYKQYYHLFINILGYKFKNGRA